MTNLKCKFFDGKSAQKYELQVSVAEDHLKLTDEILWYFDEIEIVEKPQFDRPAIISSKLFTDARLYIEDASFFLKLEQKLPKDQSRKKSCFYVSKSVIHFALFALAIFCFIKFFQHV